jgi:hypothetical protein
MARGPPAQYRRSEGFQAPSIAACRRPSTRQLPPRHQPASREASQPKYRPAKPNKTVVVRPIVGVGSCPRDALRAPARDLIAGWEHELRFRSEMWTRTPIPERPMANPITWRTGYRGGRNRNASCALRRRQGYRTGSSGMSSVSTPTLASISSLTRSTSREDGLASTSRARSSGYTGASRTPLRRLCSSTFQLNVLKSPESRLHEQGKVERVCLASPSATRCGRGIRLDHVN